MSATPLLDRLQGVRRYGGGWRANCPNGHEKTRGSLSITEGEDGRVLVTCFACHDPHQDLPNDLSYYDSKCLACHLQQPGSNPTREHPGAACPVATSGCVKCHMPRGELPGGHTVFTDHFIHVAKPDEPYPEENSSSTQHP